MPEATENTASDNQSTAQPGNGNSGSENTAQDKTVERLRDLESQVAKFAELEANSKKLEEQVKAAQTEAARWQSSYRSFQANTTAALQEASRVRQQLSEREKLQDQLTATRADLLQMKEGLTFLASKMVDEDSAKEFAARQRETQARLAEEQARQTLAQLQATMSGTQPAQQAQQIQTYVDPTDQKRDFLGYYFPNSGIDPNDPSIDWGDGAASTQEAFRRFTTSVTTLMSSKQDRQSNQGQPQNAQTDAQKLLEQLKQEREKLELDKANASKEIEEQARRAVEERLRRTGADAGNSSAAGADTRRVASKLNEVDEGRLYSSREPGAVKKVAKDMEEELARLREEYFSKYQQ